MATRTLSRRTLREQHDQAEQTAAEPVAEATDEAAPGAKVKKTRARKPAAAKVPKVKAPPKPRKKAVKVPLRRVARWVVCDGGLKRLAVFDYKDRAGADAKLAEMQEHKKGPFVLQLVKDAYDPPAVVEPVVAV